jgi:nucleotide-binding universal stress UspA family protein
MKTILAATDFTPASHNACLYASEIAGRLNGRLILFNAYQQIPVSMDDSSVIVSLNEMKDISRRQLQKEAHRINATSPDAVTIVYEEGDAAHTIMETAANVRADLIVTGIKTGGKNLRRLLGSTVTSILHKTRIPVLAVPEEARYTGIRSVALANESDLEPDADVHIMDALRDIAERFHAQVYLVRVEKNRFREVLGVLQRPFKLIRTIRSLDPGYECIEGKDVQEALNKFIKTYQVDLLAMLPHKHSLLERWFSKSQTRSMIFQTHIPLLILPEIQRGHEKALL